MIFGETRISLEYQPPPTLEEARETTGELLGYWWKPAPPEVLDLTPNVETFTIRLDDRE